MQSPICDLLGIEFPLVAFSHCRDVVAEVSKAGGMGVFGAAGIGPGKLEAELSWIDENVDGKPYGVDLIVPMTMEAKGREVSREDAISRVPRSIGGLFRTCSRPMASTARPWTTTPSSVAPG